MSAPTLSIYCCGCQEKVNARLTNGIEVYPNRADLAVLPFWRCDACGNWVGCHHKTNARTRPLDNIPTAPLRSMRISIHGILDPLWKQGRMARGVVYRILAKELGVSSYHTAEIKTIEEAHKVYAAVKRLARTMKESA